MDSAMIAGVIGSPAEDGEKIPPFENNSFAEPHLVKVKEEMKLEDIEFQSVGMSPSTEMISIKIEKIDHDDSMQEQEMNSPLMSEDSAPEEDPLELNSNMQETIVNKEVGINFQKHGKKKMKKSVSDKTGNNVASQDELNYHCKYCYRLFESNSDLDNHLLVCLKRNKGEDRFICNVCQKTFSCFSHMNYHMRTHTGERPFSCEQCGRSFPRLCELTTHVRTHTGERPYTCLVCKRSFIQSGALKSHLRTHTGERPYTCEYCQKSCSRMSDLKTHLRTHTGEKPFVCEHCQRSFSRHDSFKCHLRIHTGEKPFTCEICQKSFARLLNLKRHSKTHKGVNPSANINLKIEPELVVP